MRHRTRARRPVSAGAWRQEAEKQGEDVADAAARVEHPEFASCVFHVMRRHADVVNASVSKALETLELLKDADDEQPSDQEEDVARSRTDSP